MSRPHQILQKDGISFVAQDIGSEFGRTKSQRKGYQWLLQSVLLVWWYLCYLPAAVRLSEKSSRCRETTLMQLGRWWRGQCQRIFDCRKGDGGFLVHLHDSPSSKHQSQAVLFAGKAGLYIESMERAPKVITWLAIGSGHEAHASREKLGSGDEEWVWGRGMGLRNWKWKAYRNSVNFLLQSSNVIRSQYHGYRSRRGSLLLVNCSEARRIIRRTI